MWRLVALVACVALAAPAPARADSRACVGGSAPRWLTRTTLGLSIVPFGAEVQARGAACFPLFPLAGAWFDLALLEVGALAAVSPVYAAGGGYVTVTPNNLVSFRVEALGVGYWTLPLEGAGYYSLPAADTPRDPATTLAVGRGQEAAGFTIRALMTFQANVPLGPLALLVQDSLAVEHTEIGGGPYFVNLQIDHTQRRADLVFGNDAVLVLEIPAALAGGTVIRFGGYDSFRHVRLTGSEGNQLGGVALIGWSRPAPEIGWMEVGIRGGGYTRHAIRTGEFTLVAWWMAEWDLGAI